MLSNTLPFTITQPLTNLVVSPAGGTYGGLVSLSATLTRAADNSPISGEVVSFALNGDPVGATTTDASGVATLLFVNLGATNAGIYPTGVAATFVGDANFVGSSGTGQLTVAQRTLTVTAASAGRLYGQSNPAFTGTIVGLVNGDNITATYSSSATPASPVGSYAIVPTLADPDGRLGNYSVVSNNGVLTVNPAPLTITANDATRQYGHANPNLNNVTYSGFVNGEGPGVLSGTLSCTTTATPSSPVAGSPYPVTCSGLTSGNYNITFGPGQLTITSAPLTVTASNATREYGQANPVFTASYNGFVNGETSSVLTGTLTCTTPATTSSPVSGSPYAINCSGQTSTNYAITYVPGQLTVTPAPLTITANNTSRQYGQANPSFTVSNSGFVDGEGPGVLSGILSCTTTATPSSPVTGNPYPIICSGLTSANYSISYAPGQLTVTPAPLTITANNATKILDAPNPSFTVTYSGFVNGEGPGVLTGALSCTTTATTTSPVGSYPIACSGLGSTNYSISDVSGTLRILYQPAGPACDGDSGHIILPPVNADGTSIFKQGRTVPAKFRVCDANGVSIGTPGVVSSFFLTGIGAGTNPILPVEDVVDTNNPDTAYRWDPTSQQWIFNITTSNQLANQTYIYTITLNDGSTIVFVYGLR